MKYVGSGSLSGFAYWKASIFLRALIEGGGIPSAVLSVLGLGIFAGLSLFGARLTMDAPLLIAFIGLCVATIAAPERFGSGSFVDYRLALIPLVVLAIAIRSTWRRPALGRAAFVAVLVVLLVRSASALVAWPEADGVYAAFADATASLPENSVLLTAWGRPPRQIGWGQWWSPSVGNISTLAVLHGTFVPTVFALAAQQPLALRAKYRSWSVFLDLTGPAHVARVSGAAHPILRSAKATCVSHAPVCRQGARSVDRAGAGGLPRRPRAHRRHLPCRRGGAMATPRERRMTEAPDRSPGIAGPAVIVR